MKFGKINGWYYFGGMVANDPNDIWESLVEDNDEGIRNELPENAVEELDDGNGELAYNYIVENCKPVFIVDDIKSE